MLMPIKMRINRSAERGNVLIVILLAVVLFAGLTFTTSRSMQSDNSRRFADREIKLAATEIVDFGSKMERVVSRLRQRGCSINDITFEDNGDTSLSVDDTPYVYTNSNAPDSKKCHVFHAKGGGIQPRLPVSPKGAQDPVGMSPSSLAPRSFAVRAMSVEGTRSAATDLVLMVGRLKPALCEQINAELGLDFSVSIPEGGYDCDTQVYTGALDECANPVGDDVEAFSDKQILSFCLNKGTAGDKDLHYFHVLVSR